MRPPPKIRSVHQCISGYLGHCTQDSLEEIALPHSIHTYPHHVYTLLFYTCFSASPQRLIAVLADGGDVLWSLSEVPSPPSAACFSLSPSVLDVLIPSAHISKPQRCSIFAVASSPHSFHRCHASCNVAEIGRLRPARGAESGRLTRFRPASRFDGSVIIG